MASKDICEQIFQKSSGHYQIRSARTMTRIKLHTEDQKYEAPPDIIWSPERHGAGDFAPLFLNTVLF